MSKEAVISDSTIIDRKANPIGNDETLVRLLCSPRYFNMEVNSVNIDAFDLRILKSGDLEEFVSLARIKAFSNDNELSKYLATRGYKIWDDKPKDENNYYGYGIFNCKDAKEVHSMIEINPLIGNDKTHIGLFYRHPSGGYYCGPLPKTDIEILEVLSDLADLLRVEKAPERLAKKRNH